MGTQKTPETYKKRPKTNLKKRVNNVFFRSPKIDAKSLRGAATKLRLRRRPPTKDDPQKENHTKTNATFPEAPARLGASSLERISEGSLGHFASILDPQMHPKVGQKWKTCVFDFERLV